MAAAAFARTGGCFEKAGWRGKGGGRRASARTDLETVRGWKWSWLYDKKRGEGGRRKRVCFSFLLSFTLPLVCPRLYNQ